MRTVYVLVSKNETSFYMTIIFGNFTAQCIESVVQPVFYLCFIVVHVHMTSKVGRPTSGEER